jgi:aryl-alcohol dehydrogenase-like predicted oxidoreductase
MAYRRLGDSDLQVSAVGMGCNNFGVRMDQTATTLVVGAALDAGINFFDTADTYGNWTSETLLGRALGDRRHEVVVATKFGSRVPPGPLGGSRRYVIGAVEASLRRLGTDYIDLYQMHNPDLDTPIEETLGALDDLVSAGKVRYLGHSNFTGPQIAEADRIAREGGFSRFITAQNHYNLLEREIQAEVIPACERFGLGLLPYYPLASGLLTGKYRRGEPAAAGTRMHILGPKAADTLNERNFNCLDSLRAYANDHGHSLLDLAFAWMLGQPMVSSVIAGATRPEQVWANVAAATWQLTPAEVAEVSELTGNQS